MKLIKKMHLLIPISIIIFLISCSGSGTSYTSLLGGAGSADFGVITNALTGTVISADGTITATSPDGTITVTKPDGTITITRPDGTVIITDPVTNPDGTTTTTTPDGTITVTAADGTITATKPDGTITVTKPDGTITVTKPDGTIIVTKPNGTVIVTRSDGTVIVTNSDGTGSTTNPDGSVTLNPGTGEINGTISTSDGIAVTSGTITVTGGSLPGPVSLTVTSGTYRISLPVNTGYNLKFDLAGYDSFNMIGVDILLGLNILLNPVTLAKLPDPAYPLSGIVKTAAYTGEGISGVVVTIKNSSGITVSITNTDSLGNWSVNLNAGTYTVMYSATGYESYLELMELTAGGTNSIVTIMPDDKSGTVYGDITGNSLDGTAVPVAAKILIMQGATQINVINAGINGSYNFKILPGTYTAIIRAAGYQDINVPAFTVSQLSNTKKDFSISLISGTISGVVKDVNGVWVENVTVNVFFKENSTPLQSLTTGPKGDYIFTLPVINPMAGDYYRLVFTFTKDGSTYNITYLVYNLFDNNNTPLQPITIVLGAAPGIVSGKIRSSIDGSYVSGAVIKLRQGVDVRQGNYYGSISAATDSSGSYSIGSLTAGGDLAPGSYTAEITAAGYTTGYFTIVCDSAQTRPNQNSVISPTNHPLYTLGGRVEIKLSWGSSPSDLDSHFTGPVPSGTGRYYLYWPYSESYYNTWAYKDCTILDVDDTTSYGPETVTVKTFDYVKTLNIPETDKCFRYAIHDYSNRSNSTSKLLSISGAIVTVTRYDMMMPNGQPMGLAFYIPQDITGTVWKVFEAHYNSNYFGQWLVTPVNSVSYIGTTSNKINGFQ